MIGHLLGAAGAVQAVARTKSLETGVLHPTINYESPDPDCDLGYVANEARETHPRTAMSKPLALVVTMPRSSLAVGRSRHPRPRRSSLG